MTTLSAAQTSPTATTNSKLPAVLYAYCLVIHPAFLVVPFFLFSEATPSRVGLSLPGFFRLDVTDPLALALYAAALTIGVAAVMLPRLLVARLAVPSGAAVAASTSLFMPYMIRLLMFEVVTTLGVVMSILHSSPLLGVPFFVVGFAGALASPPTTSFFERFGHPAGRVA